MSMTAIALNGLLAVLLLVALMFGVRLERRLKALRDSHEGFAKAVADLDRAAMRAEQGLADLRAATDEAADSLAWPTASPRPRPWPPSWTSAWTGRWSPRRQSPSGRPRVRCARPNPKSGGSFHPKPSAA
jgi:hypothetical protein